MTVRFRRTSLFLGLLALLAVGSAPGTGIAAAAGVGDPLPAISLVDASTEKPVQVAEALKGAVGVLVYMQTSCAACRKELTALKDLQGKYPKLKVVAVSVDAGGPERAVSYKKNFGFEFPFLQDPEFKTPELFGFSFTPGMVLVGKDGNVAFIKGGFRPGDEAEIEAKIMALTAQ
ncbi:MAG: TlpA family protein disulfide reductase [Deltaproteobacteria bacterium]|nr:TlpA family protein disulfide reductase [Deltaproteobacteria bacterium]